MARRSLLPSTNLSGVLRLVGRIAAGAMDADLKRHASLARLT